MFYIVVVVHQSEAKSLNARRHLGYVLCVEKRYQGFVFKSSKCFTLHGHISCLKWNATGLGAWRRCSSSAPGHCQSRLEGFGGAGLDYASV